MGELGRIKSVSVSDNVITCEVLTLENDQGVGPVKTATLYCAPGFNVYPLAGDEVKISYCGGEWVIDAVFMQNSIDGGETLLFGRDSSGAVVCSLHLKNDGTLSYSNNNGNFILEAGGSFNVNNGNLEVLP